MYLAQTGERQGDMRSSSIRAIRRDELSRAAFEAVIRYGLRGTTLDKVGEIAGVSKGVVLHHFKDKSALLEAVFRRTNGLISESVIELYRYAETPYERLWISEVPHSGQCQRIQVACNKRIESNMLHELKYFLEPGVAEQAARYLSHMIDGMWVRAGMVPNPITGQEATREIEFALLQLLPDDELSRAKHREALKKMQGVAAIALARQYWPLRSGRRLPVPALQRVHPLR